MEGTPDLKKYSKKMSKKDLRRSVEDHHSKMNTRNQIKVSDGRRSPALTQLNSLDLGPSAEKQHKMLSPSPSKRSMSMGYPNTLNSSPKRVSEHKNSHPASMTMMGYANYQSITPTVLKAPQRKEIREREGKSEAVRNLINQTIVSHNKLLVFKPI